MGEDNNKRNFTDLRKLAEAVQRERMPSPQLSGDLDELLHELEVHQIELEMQHRQLQEVYEIVEESRQRFSDLFDFAPVGYVITDEQGVIHQANLTIASMLGIERDSLIEKKLSLFVVDDAKDAYYIHRRRVFRSEKQESCELKLRRCNNSTFFAQLNSEIMSDDGGICLTSVTDVSRIKQAEATMHRALLHEKSLNELKSRLISVISHEVRTPLSAILLAVGMLDTYGADLDTDKRKQRYDSIRTYVWYLNDIVNDVVMAHRLGEDASVIKPVSFKILPFVQQLVHDLNHLEPEPRIQFTIEKEGNLDLVTWDEHLIRRIFINLLQNALKYSSDEVMLRVLCRREAVKIEVEDKGPGIPPGDQPHIFNMFYRGSNTTSIRGTGVGLGVVKLAIEAHGGTIKFRTSEGGTTFQVYLPRHVMKGHEA